MTQRVSGAGGSGNPAAGGSTPNANLGNDKANDGAGQQIAAQQGKNAVTRMESQMYRDNLKGSNKAAQDYGAIGT